MKKNTFYKKTSTFIVLLLLVTSCVDLDDNLDKPGVLVSVEVSPNDPKESGLTQGCSGVLEPAENITTLAINPSLPQIIDLSPLMPPVRSQGHQASCVSWATTYYLKSYQEKKQYGYDYSDYSTVMSPAFIFNQTKIPPDCSIGSCIENALYVLKTKGTTSWLGFPYNDNNCSLLPTQVQFASALHHKISRYFRIDEETIISNQTYSRLDVIKYLLFLENPVIIGIKTDINFSQSTPRNNENVYMYNTYIASQNYGGGGHAMLIVGYDDGLNAFKVVNSWGSAWGNEGYCWINYNFFKPIPDPNYELGIVGVFAAYD